MNRTNLATLTLSAALLLNGCASTTVNGEDPQMSNAGKIIVGLIVVGALAYLASEASGDNDEPDATLTTYCSGTVCQTEYRDNR